MKGVTDRIWSLASLWPLAALAAVLAAQTLYCLDCRALWYSDEVRYANVFEHLEHAGKWLVMYLNGQPYSDKPPLYFWFLAGLRPLFPHIQPALFMLGSAVSALLVLGATSLMARRVLGADRNTSLAAGLILLTCFYFIGVAHYTRMDLLFAFFITLAHVFLFHAWNKDRAPLAMFLGFLFVSAAVLTKGPLGFAFPVVAGVIYLLWTGRPLRLFRRDVLLGLILFVVLVGGWLALAWAAGEEEFVRRIFYKEVYKRALDAPHHRQGLWYYFGALPLAWLPWTLVILVLPLSRLFNPGFYKGVWDSRKSSERGRAYLWILFLSGFVLLTLVSIKIIIYLLPLFPALAILTADRVLKLDERSTRLLFYAVGGLMLLAAAALPFANLIHHWPVEISGLWVAAGAAALAGAAIIYGSRLGPRGALIATSLAVTFWLLPLNAKVAPSLDPVMSPKQQGALMGRYAQAGYPPMAFKIYSGAYTYYANATVVESQDLAWLGAQIERLPKAVIGMQKRYWDEWRDRPAGLRVVHEQWIVERPYVLAVKGPLLDGATASESGRDAQEAVPEQAPAGNRILRLEHLSEGNAFHAIVYTSAPPEFEVQADTDPPEITARILDAAKPALPKGMRKLDGGSMAKPAVEYLRHEYSDGVFTVHVGLSAPLGFGVRRLDNATGLGVTVTGLDMPPEVSGGLDMEDKEGN